MGFNGPIKSPYPQNVFWILPPPLVAKLTSDREDCFSQRYDAGQLVDEDKPFHVFFVVLFSTFEMDQLGKIRQHHWKERLLTDCHDCNKLYETNMPYFLSEHLCQLPKRVHEKHSLSAPAPHNKYVRCWLGTVHGFLVASGKERKSWFPELRELLSWLL